MTQPSQNKQILQKLDEIAEQQVCIGKQVARLEKHIEMQPLIDKETHKAIIDRFDRVEERTSKIEEAQIWATRLIIGTALSSLVALVLAFSKFIGGL
jgi:uncharacterized protein involved in copper resistance